MPITINGSGTVSGISAGGLPDDSIVTADIANGAVTQAKRSEQLTLGTAQASTSGTSIDFTGIPSWVKRVTVMFDSVSTNGSSILLLQVGDSGGIETTSYSSNAFGGANGNVVSGATSTAGFLLAAAGLSTYSMCGHAIITNTQSNTWVSSGALGATSTGAGWSHGGTKTLSGTLDRIRITTVNGTDTFDAGSINILYE